MTYIGSGTYIAANMSRMMTGLAVFLWMGSIQAQDFRAVAYGVEVGLPSTAVTQILKGRDGFMWFGTQDGLVRFDGHTMRIFRHRADDEHSLSDNVITALVQDRSGLLWVGTENGLNRLDPTTHRVIRFQNDGSPLSLPHNLITALAIDRGGRLWIGTERGLCLYTSGYFVKFTADDHEFIVVRSIFEDRSGRMWIGTRRDGLLKLDPQRMKLTSAGLTERDPDLLTVWTMAQDREGEFWLGGPTGLWRMSENLGLLTRIGREAGQLSNERVRAIAIDAENRLWLGTTAGGLNLYDRRLNSWMHHGNNHTNPLIFRDYYIHDLFIDPDGFLWIASDPGGIVQVDLSAGSFQHVSADRNNPASLSNNIVKCFLVDRAGNLWVGTDDGIDFRLKGSAEFIHYKAGPGRLPDKQVRALYEDDAGNIWIGTEIHGMARLDPRTNTFQYFPNEPGGLRGPRVYDFYQDAREAGRFLWIATFRGGLNRLDLKSNTFVNYPAQSSVPGEINDVWSMVVDSTGLFWLASRRDGVYTFDPRTERFRYLRHDASDPESLSDNRVLSLCKDREGRIWIGTADGLNCVVSRDGRCRRFTEKEGLPSNVINGMVDDGAGNLWGSTNKGIFKMGIHSGLIKHFDVRDGLQGSEFERGSCYRASDGRIFFGGSNGYNVFVPEQLPVNTTPPPVIISDFKVGDQSLELEMDPNYAAQIDLDDDQNFFSIEFAALNYISPSKNTYAYRLTGIDDNWIYSRERRLAMYTKIGPGDYVFRVKAANNDGVWNEDGKTLHIHIRPPFWSTWWFRGSATLVLASLVFLGYRYRVSSIERRNRLLELAVRSRTAELRAKSLELQVAHDELEHKVAERTRQLQNLSSRLQVVREDERQYLAREIHDELGSQLTALKMEFALVQRQMKENGDMGGFDSVERLTDGAIRTIQRISKELRPPILDDLGLGEALLWQIEEFRKRNRIACTHAIDANLKMPAGLAITVFRIFQELLTNVSRHSGATELHVEAVAEEQNLELIAVDNGRGILDAELNDANSIGLIGIRERVRPWGGQVVFENVGKGTRVRISIPLPEEVKK